MTTMPPTPPPPPLGGVPRSGWGDERPTGLANATIGLTGGTALLTLLGAWASLSIYEDFNRYAGPDASMDATYLASQGLSSLASLLMLGSYVTLALWMTKIHKRLTDAGETMPLAPAWAWFVWLIPVANIVMPYLYFRGLNRRARSGAVLPWWLAYVGSGVATLVGAAQMIAASDFSVAFQDQNDPLAGLDFTPLGMSTLVSAILLFVSWVFLTMTLRSITARDVSGRDPLLP